MAPPSALARDIYVAPGGAPGNDGSIQHPVDLATALSAGSPAQPGDTIWLRGGVYAGNFTSALTGTATRPIVVRQMIGEHANIDGSVAPNVATLTVNGAYTIYWGFEISNSDPNRLNGLKSRGTGLDIFGPYTQFINLVIHDHETAIGLWTPAVGAQLYGNIVYNNGDDGADRGHGHSIYVQNDVGTKRLADNVLLNSFSFGIHAYTEAGNIDNLEIDGNISFNHGMLSLITGAKSNLLLGGGQQADHTTITNNYTYYPSGVNGRGADIGYTTTCDDANVVGNTFVGATAVNLNCTDLVFDGNVVAGSVSGEVPATYPSNNYYAARPTGLQVFVRPNLFEAGRANIAVYNWDHLAQVNLDLSQAGLTSGQTYELRDAQNFYGPPALTFTYTGAPITVTMTGGTVAAPVGNAPVAPVNTRPEFGAFVVAPKTPAPEGLVANIIASPSSIAQNRPFALTWHTANAVSVSIDQGIGAVVPSGFLPLTASATKTFTLTATDAAGNTITRTATVVVVADAPPIVSLTSPAPNVAYQAPANLTIAADASDSDGTVTQVAFYSGSTLLGVVTSAPYTWSLTNLPTGSYSLTAVALDNRGGSATSSPIAFTVVDPVAGTAAVTFVGTDTATLGTWKGTYGADGSDVATDAVSLPAYAQVGFAGQSSWVWAKQSTLTRALQRPGDNTRLAATWYSATTFDIDVNVSGPTDRQIALYCLDYDKLGREQAIYVIDAATNRVLDTRVLSSFINGQYWVWRLHGHVIFRLARIGGANAVVSGIFFDTPTGISPPTVSITSPLFGTSFTAPADVTLTAAAAASGGSTIDHVTFYAGASPIGTASTAPYTIIWPAVPAGGYGVTATATDSAGATSTSAPLTVVVKSPSGGGGGGAATFVRTDASTQGSWVGVYGTDGYLLLGGAASYPAYAQVTLAGQQTWVWAGASSDVRALQQVGTTNRIAGTAYSATSFTIDINLVDGLTHQIAFYALDWDGAGRQETIDVSDATSGAALDAARAVSGFSGGQYWIWQASGHIKLKITRVSGPNAGVTGLFFDPIGIAGSGGPPVVTLTTSTPLPATAPATIALATSTTGGTIKQMDFFDGTTPIGSVTASPFALTWTNVPAGSHLVVAKATDTANQVGTSNTLTVAVNPASSSGGTTASAGFVKSDTTTQGAWSGSYGADGYGLANGGVTYPSYAQVALSGNAAWTWSASTVDARALQTTGSSTTRLAATWYASTSFTIDVTLKDGASHQVSLYSMDWDSQGRQQTIDVLDAATGASLDTHTLAGFSRGAYLVWRIAGHVVFKITRSAGPNAVVSGLFFDAGASGTPPTIAWTAPDPLGSYTAPTTLTVSADVHAPGSSVTQVKLLVNGTPLTGVTAAGSSYQASWNITAGGTYTLTASATNSVGQTTVSAPFAVSVGGPTGSGGTTASFVGFDTITNGTWKGTYGAQGYALAGDATSLPPALAVSLNGQSSWIWGSSSDTRALQRPTFGDRLAAAWYAANAFSADVNVADGTTRQIALYLLDWDGAARSETIQVLDQATGTVLATRTISAFSSGQYAVWRVSGHVTFVVTRTGGPNAVVSGLFIDP